MGSYGIGVSARDCAIEQNCDDDGIICSKAPPHLMWVTITTMKQDEIREAGEKLYKDLRHAGLMFCLTIAMSAPE